MQPFGRKKFGVREKPPPACPQSTLNAFVTWSSVIRVDRCENFISSNQEKKFASKFFAQVGQLLCPQAFEGRNSKLKFLRAVPRVAVVVAQVVEQWHSVRAVRVWIQGQTWLFWFRIAVHLFSLGVLLSLRTSNRTVHTPSSSSF